MGTIVTTERHHGNNSDDWKSSWKRDDWQSAEKVCPAPLPRASALRTVLFGEGPK